MQFRDKMLTCEQCGSRFVFTVTEQRGMAERGVELNDPKFCPRCRDAEESGVKLICEGCGSQFIFTVTEQRAMAERGAESFEPKFCPSCRSAEEPGVKLIGRVKWFEAHKGWGFITKSNGEDIFVHRTGVEGHGILQEGQRVEFRIEQTPKGAAAVEVVPLPTDE